LSSSLKLYSVFVLYFMLTNSEILNMSESQLRYEEAKYFLAQFVKHLSPDSYFHMIAYLDAFLLCLISIEDLDQRKYKKALNEQSIFKFLKATRNITAHEFIIASISEKRPFWVEYIRSQFAFGGGGFASTRLNISIEKFRQIFAKALADPKRNKRDKETLELAENYLKCLENRPETLLGKLDIVKVAQEGLDAVAKLLWPT
jgi:hypothetical protein